MKYATQFMLAQQKFIFLFKNQFYMYFNHTGTFYLYLFDVIDSICSLQDEHSSNTVRAKIKYYALLKC